MKETSLKKHGKYICYNTAGRDLPDIYALALGRCAPSGIVRIYQANPSLLCYNIYLYHSAWAVQRLLQCYKCDMNGLINGYSTVMH